ncbi:type I DNA topoisomerase, partial [Candidatus Falkowbacteria bacterium]|nr:type I DNA topoisomerase [Candidatus Falkowbacteria bacterium]
MSKKLVIVESPTKAKTISKFLNNDFKVESSFGHVRDLPTSKMGVDLEHDFEPTYIILTRAKKRVSELKKLAEKADLIYFATDEDREGEAIAWHLAQIFKTPIGQTQRITFHEITKEAINEALKNPRQIDLDLVDAQQARRILDRLVGYKLSPLLWKKVTRGLSAGRVQSVVVRLIVEKERDIQNFKVEEYWEIFGDFQTKQNEKFTAKLQKIDGKTLDKLEIKSKKEADNLLALLAKQNYYVADIIKKEVSRNPLPPFTTSTLQQEANRRLGFSAKQTMMIAQQLYEGIDMGGDDSVGLITYMRT